MSICSAHREPVEGCAACAAMPWDVLGTTKTEWDVRLVYAASEGLINCTKCGFEMYKATCRVHDDTFLCPLCNRYFEEEPS